MKDYTFFTDYTTLSKAQSDDWVGDCSRLADEAFQESSNETCLLGNLLVLEQYFHTLCQGMAAEEQEPEAVVQEAIDLLWDYLYGKKEISDFEDFANHLYACVLEYMVGEELTEEQCAFAKEHFQGDDDTTLQWSVLGWASMLLLELVAIHHGRLDFEEFASCDKIDFVEIDEMLNGLSDACLEFTDVECKSNRAKDVIPAFQEVYVTPLFQSIVCKVQKSLKDAIEAKKEDYEALRKEYQQYTILPEEYAAALLEF